MNLAIKQSAAMLLGVFTVIGARVGCAPSTVHAAQPMVITAGPKAEPAAVVVPRLPTFPAKR